MSFFDVFSNIQPNSSALPFTLASNWGPPSTRILFTSTSGILVIANQDINASILGQWNLTLENLDEVTGSALYNLIYTFTPATNFSAIASISITQISGPATFLNFLTLTLSDGVNNVTSFGQITGTTKTWFLPTDFPGVSLGSIVSASFVIALAAIPAGSAFMASFDNLVSTVVCVAKDTQILMADKSLKSIQDIQRGDLVAGDPQCTDVHRVARLNTQNLSPEDPVDLLTFERDCLGVNQPNQRLMITKNHPIIYQDARRPAYCFQNHQGVIYHQKVHAGQILPINDNQTYTVYDLQFDHDGTYVANGLILQSRSPYSQLTPLPRELYFNDDLYTDEKVSDSYDQILPLDTKTFLNFQSILI